MASLPPERFFCRLQPCRLWDITLFKSKPKYLPLFRSESLRLSGVMAKTFIIKLSICNRPLHLTIMNIRGYSRRPVGHGRASLYGTLLVTAPSPIQFGMTACKDQPIHSTFYLLPTK